MKLKRAQLDNFASYEHLEFDFSVPGLNLVQGATGSGKSTLFDAPAWILFGITAKDGSVDDVRSWNDLSLPTIGVITVELADGKYIDVTRVRGRSNENDLYWIEEGDVSKDIRGTNIKETQTLLNLRLGLDSSAYLAGAYFSEQSPSASLFISNASQRKALFDRIANLAFPTALSDRLSDKITASKKILVKSESDILSLNRQLLLITSNLKDSTVRSEDWDAHFLNKAEELQSKSLNFASKKAEDLRILKGNHDVFETARQASIEEIKADMLGNHSSSKVCPTCKSTIDVDLAGHFQKELDRVVHYPNPHAYSIEETETRVNNADEQLKDHFKQVNPFKAQVAHFATQRQSISLNIDDEQLEYDKLKFAIQDYEQLKELSGALKEQLLVRSMEKLHYLTNKYLRDYFEGELSVDFVISGPNALDVHIFKNGHEAVYKQLSKGQRQLLKLSFSVAVMASIADRSGVHFSNLFFDEALDGLDSELKVKAFSLFSSLELDHESIFVIDHAEEFKSLFSKQYVVTIEADKSAIVDAEQPDFNT